MAAATPPMTAVLGDPRLRRELARTIGRRVHPVDVDDVVQTTLAEALAAKALPSVEDEARRFVFAIARQKVADVHRRRGREQRRVWPESETHAPPPSNDVARWLERVLPSAPDDGRTLDWIVREAEGETLAEIATAERVSPAMVRQRVSRLRRWLRARWAKDVAIIALLVLVAASLALGKRAHPTIVRERERDLPIQQREEVVSPPESEPAILTNPHPVDPTPLPKKKPSPGASRASTPVVTSSPAACPQPCAFVSTRTMTRSSPNGTTEIERSIDITLPRLDAGLCATPTSRPGVGQVSVTFLPTGSIAHVDVTGPFTRSEMACVQRLYEGVHARPFQGDATIARTFVVLVPEPPPAWAEPLP